MAPALPFRMATIGLAGILAGHRSRVLPLRVFFLPEEFDGAVMSFFLFLRD